MLLILEKFLWANIVDLVTFPVWWYSRGLAQVFLLWGKNIQRANETLGVSLWFANLFTPMFGQRDWQGRIISFVMRFVQLIARGIAFAVCVLILSLMVAVWIVALPVIVYGIVDSFFSMLV